MTDRRAPNSKYRELHRAMAAATRPLAEQDYPPGSITKEMFTPKPKYQWVPSTSDALLTTKLSNWLMMHVGSQEAEQLMTLVNEAVAAEREACAQIVEKLMDPQNTAEAIRAR